MPIYPGLQGDLYNEKNGEDSESPQLKKTEKKPAQEMSWSSSLRSEKQKERNQVVQSSAPQRSLRRKNSISQRIHIPQKRPASNIQLGAPLAMNFGQSISQTQETDRISQEAGLENTSVEITNENESRLENFRGSRARKKMEEINKQSLTKDAKNVATQKAKSLIKKRIKWWIITAVGGFIVANLPIILIVFIILVIVGFVITNIL